MATLTAINFSYRRLAVAYVTWCMCWIVLQAYALHHTFGVPWNLALSDGSITNALLAACGYVLISIMRFYQPIPGMRLAMSLFMSVCCVWIAEFCMTILGSDTPDYIAILDKSTTIRMLYSWLMISLISSVSWLWFSIKEQQETAGRSSTAEKLAREAELSKLRQQLQPHFLFNSLNSISALAGTKPEQARKMIQQLSDFLRGTLKKDDQQLVTLSEELDHLNLYLEIEKVRFGHRLKTVIEKDDQSLSLRLPSLLLQPVVENAIKFGLYDTTGETEIRVEARAEDGYLKLMVSNPFDPATAQPKQGTGFGLNSVQRRLYLLYARQDLLTTSQQDNIFKTQILIPQTA